MFLFHSRSCRPRPNYDCIRIYLLKKCSMFEFQKCPILECKPRASWHDYKTLIFLLIMLIKNLYFITGYVLDISILKQFQCCDFFFLYPVWRYIGQDRHFKTQKSMQRLIVSGMFVKYLLSVAEIYVVTRPPWQGKGRPFACFSQV